MDCKSLNKIQRDKMNAITKNVFEMEWENPEFMDILMGELPKVRHSQGDDDILAEINQLKKELLSYDAFSSNKEEFISKISNCIDTIHTKKEYWFGLSLHKVKECVHQHEFCMISGEGGIGKSYFIKCFEERLENKNIPHLCIYGKFEKDISNINAARVVPCHFTKCCVFRSGSATHSAVTVPLILLVRTTASRQRATPKWAVFLP